jgi:hypothetical protein
MSDDIYNEISCPNCESQYAVDFIMSNVNGDPEYCPFCGEEIPEENTDDNYDDDEKVPDDY